MEFFRAVPVLLMMIYIFFTFGAGEGGIGSYWSVVIALTLYNGAVLAEVFRAGILAVPPGQGEAAYALGMRKSQVMRQILMPQGVKIMLPSIISQCIVALKDTSLGYVILAPGLTRVGKSIFLEFQNQVQTAIVLGRVLHPGEPGADLGRDLGAAQVRRREDRPGDRRRRPVGHHGVPDLADRLVGHPEPDDALDDDRAVVTDAADPHGHVGVGRRSTARGRSRRCR